MASKLDKLLATLQSAVDDVVTHYDMVAITVEIGQDRGPAYGRSTYLGLATYHRRTIYIDHRLTAEKMLDTLKHEIAHFMAWDFERHRGHGWIWRRYATMLGADPHAKHYGKVFRETT